MPGPLLDTLRGTIASTPPVWFMRQAGRYLPEYRALRAEKGGFLELVYDSDAAAEVTVQPLRRFAFDGAILFSDILIVPYAMGQNLRFLAGEGPHLSPRLAETALSDLQSDHALLTPIYDTVGKVSTMIGQAITMLGFAGSPWTVATYMVNGEGSKDQMAARVMAYRDRERFAALIDAITQITIEYLCGQIEAGAEAVQLFDSWAGSLAPNEFDRWVIAPNAAIVAEVRKRHPDTPIIGFPKGSGAKLLDYVAGTGVDGLGLDETVDPEWAARVLPGDLPLQGNLDPLLLLAGGEALDRGVDAILNAFAGRPHIFNLGHGIDRTTPIAHVDQVLKWVRKGN